MGVHFVLGHQRGLGQSNPVWEPVPDHYFPLSSKETVYYIIAVSATIASVLGIFIGFLFWAVSDLEKYVLTWTIVVCGLLVIFLILIYFGGKDRRRQEKELIQ